MAGYKRFVSYIYAYPNGKKERNTGFAKIEARGGQCKIQIRLQKIPTEETMVEVYGFVRRRGGFQGIFLGRIQNQRGVAEGTFLTAEEAFGGSRWSLSGLSGLWARGVDGTDYITVWDDLPVEAGQLEIGPEPERPAEAESESAAEPVPEPVPSAAPGLGGTAEPVPEPVPSAAEPGLEGTAEPVLEPVPSAAPGSEGTAKPVPEPEPAAASGQKNTRAVALPAASPALQAQEAACPLPASVCPHTRYCPPGLSYRWDCLSKNYAHRNPFYSPDIQDCLQICPRDLAALRQQNWNLNRNSFLLHGYLNYHYLLLVRRRDGSFLLGIPGVYAPQEERMAAMFGFPQFLGAPGENRGKDFGYWCRPVD